MDEHKRIALEVICANNPGWGFTLFDNPHSRIDATLQLDRRHTALAEVKSRFDCDMEKVCSQYNGELYVSMSKMDTMRQVCWSVGCEGYVVFFIVRSGLVLMRKVYNDCGMPYFCCETGKRMTQDTCNGGTKEEEVFYIPVNTPDCLKYPVTSANHFVEMMTLALRLRTK